MPPRPRRIVRLCAAILALATVTFWAAKGAHRGWTQHRVPVKQIDEVTGLDHITYEDRYVPGLDVLGGGLAASALLFGASFLFSRTSPKSTA